MPPARGGPAAAFRTPCVTCPAAAGDGAKSLFLSLCISTESSFAPPYSLFLHHNTRALRLTACRRSSSSTCTCLFVDARTRETLVPGRAHQRVLAFILFCYHAHGTAHNLCCVLHTLPALRSLPVAAEHPLGAAAAPPGAAQRGRAPCAAPPCRAR